MMEASSGVADRYSPLGEDQVETGRYQDTAAAGVNETSLPKQLSGTSVSEDGYAAWILCGLLMWLYLWGNWANMEPVVTCHPYRSDPNRTVDCINDSAWLPHSYYLSLYFLMALGILTLLHRTAVPPLLLGIITIISVFQDWVLFGVYMPPSNDFAKSQSSRASSLIHFSQVAAVFAHLSKYMLVVLAFKLFNIRGGTIKVLAVRRTYQHMTASGPAPAY